MKEKIFKYYKIVVFLFLSINLIGLYFIYTGQFKTSENNNVLDFIPTVSLAYDKFRTALSWVALVLMLIAWIMWEFAISKSGKRIYAIISMGLFFIQMIMILNLLSIIGILFAIGLMAYYTWARIGWESKMKSSEAILQTAQENKENNRKFRDLFKKKPKSKTS